MIVDIKLIEFKEVKEVDEPATYTIVVETGDSRNGSMGMVPGLTWEQAMPLIYMGIPVEVSGEN